MNLVSPILDPQVGGIAKHGTDSGMGILHVIDRIFIGSAAKHINIHHHGGIHGIANQGVSSGIHADLLHKFFQGNDGSSALTQLKFFAIFHDLDHLSDQDINIVIRIVTGTGGDGFEAIDVAMVIGAQHVDANFKTALPLTDVVGRIRCEVRKCSI